MTLTPKFNLGDNVFRATWDSEPAYITCPDCGGTKFVTVRLWDGTEHTLDCDGCKKGYYPPSGTVLYYKRTPAAKSCIITGISIEAKDNKIEYTCEGEYTYRCDQSDLFRDQAICLKYAEKKAKEAEEREKENELKKVKAHRNWSWHVHYYRRQIRDAKKTIERAEAALSVARVKAKEEKA